MAFAVVASGAFATPTRAASATSTTRPSAAGAVTPRRAALRMAADAGDEVKAAAKDVKASAKDAAGDAKAAVKDVAGDAKSAAKDVAGAAKAKASAGAAAVKNAAPAVDASQNPGAGKFGPGGPAPRVAKMDAPDIFGALKTPARGKSQDEMWEENSKDKGPTGTVQKAAGNVEKAKNSAKDM